LSQAAAEGNAAAAGGAARLLSIDFADIEGWAADDHAAAFAAFLVSARAIADRSAKSKRSEWGALAGIARAALESRQGLDAGAARAFFEQHFAPARIDAAGFVTGYYEPEIMASRERSAGFSAPLYRRPANLVEVDPTTVSAGFDPALTWGLATPAGMVACPDRQAIEAGALAGLRLELAWLQSAVDAFFIHVQGSARLRFPDGGIMRVAFAGKSGHPYTSIGRLAVERGWLSLEQADRDGLDAFLRAQPDEGRAVMAANRSFIFFRETDQPPDAGPIGAAGVPLVAGRSLALDRAIHAFHSPVFVAAPALMDPDRKPLAWRRLMVAHDTGSAIRGPARGDLYFGSGDAAGSAAGRVRHAATMTVLLPREPL
jgi:membrane-bound lytic murein transglycosylase A